jgi:small conductance mechanosensitive channel
MRDFFTDIDWHRWSETIWTHGARIVVIALGVYISLRVLRRVLTPAFRTMIATQMRGQPDVEIEKRVETLSHVVYRSIAIAAMVIGLLTVLPELGINTSALLAGAGLLGLAIGIGAQSLVRDILSGLFILMENQYGRGDVVKIAGVGGLVEDVNLRRTLLRDLDGAVHSVPNGQIAVASNLTRSWARVNTVVNVDYTENVDRVCAVIDRVGEELAQDPAWQGDVTGAPRALGVEGLSDTRVEIRVLGETQPSRQWDVAREFRRRLKQEFEREGIRLAS